MCGLSVGLRQVCARCGEGLFNPTAIGLPAAVAGLAAAVAQTLGLCDISLREELYANVVLVGGGSLIKGFAERMGACCQTSPTRPPAPS